MAEAKVEQTEKRKSKVMTGLGAFDTMIGGLPNGIIILLVGEPGSGYDIFAQQVLHAQASKGESKVAYLTVEKPPDDIQNDMIVRNWEVDSLIGNGSWKFLDGFTSRINVSKGNAGPKAVLDILTKNLLNSVKEDRWTAIDTISYFLANFEMKDVISVLDDLILEARERGGLHFLLAVPKIQDDRALAAMSHMVDGIFEFTLRADQSDPLGDMRIKKLRKAEHVTRLIPYRIGPNGLVIETARRIA
ncbi:MAG: hypothetical protein IH932_01385 [Thaumarchaeota archaeon]|nr:hypothetical protein [Nitrososphaerota archaeon]